MWKFPNLTKNVDEIQSPNIYSPELLYWCEWSNYSLTSYLNLIDYDRKQQSIELIPWYYIPSTANDMLQFCESNIFGIYKMYIISQLAACDRDRIPNLIKKLLRVCETYRIACKGDEASLYCYIVNCLSEYSYDDPNLLLDVWGVLCSQSDLAKEAVFTSLDSKSDRRKNAKILRYILKNARIAQFGFWGAWVKEHESERYPFCPVTSALVNGNVEQMTILLQYGFQQNSERSITYDKYFLNLTNSVYSWLKKPLERQRNKRRSILTEVMLFLIQTARCQSDLQFASLVKCFRLLWNITPVPFVTRSELRDEVRKRFRKPHKCEPTSVFPYKQSQFLRLCEVYTWIQPEEATDVVQPRLLQHLCKCTIRKALVEAFNLPDGIEALPIPVSLQAYISVQDIPCDMVLGRC